MVTGPPVPFDPAIDTVAADHLLYRVLSATRTATSFSPGFGARTRFGFFASPADRLWLVDLCAPLHVDVLMQPS